VRAPDAALSEARFAALVESLKCDRGPRARLVELLREEHSVYDQRGTAATVRMRGWVLLALAHAELPDSALIHVLEELDTGRDAYLVAVAARALRAYAKPSAALAPFVLRALINIRYHDETVCLDAYGEYAVSTEGTTPVRELITTLHWLGAHARAILPELEVLLASCQGLSRAVVKDLGRAIQMIRTAMPVDEPDADRCCVLPVGLGNALSWPFGSRRASEEIQSALFEDHNGATITFADFFHGRPSIVAFFYTRCDNPQKCSLTISKLARVQQLLRDGQFEGRIRTAAITYDSAFDVPARLQGYGRSRGLRMDEGHRMLRAMDDLNALRVYFGLGVNFIESLVNRHRVEVYVLDARGRIATFFQRLHWDEQQVVDAAVRLLDEERLAPPSSHRERSADRPDRAAVPIAVATAASIGAAFLPKCPVCWTAYLSVLGVAGLEKIPYSPWLLPVLVGAMLINLYSVWRRGRATKRTLGFYVAATGALVVAGSSIGFGFERAAPWGVALTLIGSLLSVVTVPAGRPLPHSSSTPC
jgi:protein SCO1